MDNVFHAQSVNMLSCDINSLLCVSCSLSTCIKSIFGRGPGGNRMGGGGGGGTPESWTVPDYAANVLYI